MSPLFWGAFIRWLLKGCKVKFKDVYDDGTQVDKNLVYGYLFAVVFIIIILILSEFGIFEG